MAVASVVVSVSSNTTPGSYWAGNSIALLMTFDQPVDVLSGIPTLALAVGRSKGLSFVKGLGSSIRLQHIDFATVIGAASVSTQSANTVLVGDSASQQLTVQSGSASKVYAGGGDDILSFAVTGVLTGATNVVTTLHGGAGNDVVSFNGALADFTVEYPNGYVMVNSKSVDDAKAMVINAKQLQFSDTRVQIAPNKDLETIAGIYQMARGSQADVSGFECYPFGCAWWHHACSLDIDDRDGHDANAIPNACHHAVRLTLWPSARQKRLGLLD